jgi:hypothetical protein
MGHHAHLVKTRLSVEENVIVVLQMALYNPSVLEQGVCPLVILEVDTLTGVPDDIASTGIFLRSSSHEFGKPLNVIASD